MVTVNGEEKRTRIEERGIRVTRENEREKKAKRNKNRNHEEWSPKE